MPTKKNEQIVKYVGFSDVRRIRKSDWESLDIVQDDVQWDAQNSFSVPVSALSAEAIKYCCEVEGDFVVTDAPPAEEAEEPDAYEQTELEV